MIFVFMQIDTLFLLKMKSSNGQTNNKIKNDTKAYFIKPLLCPFPSLIYLKIFNLSTNSLLFTIRDTTYCQLKK